MQRKALLLYLQELRALEFANWKLTNIYNAELAKFNEKYHDLTHVSYMDVPLKFDGWTDLRRFFWGSCLVLSIMYPLIFICGSFSGEKILANSVIRGFCIFGFFLFGGLTLGIYYCVKRDRRENKKSIEEAEEYNTKEFTKYVTNQEKAEKLKNAWEAWSVSIRKENEKVISLLKSNYDLGIIPDQHRNIASIYYIYEYMSVSNASLEETMNHEEMENGIQGIVERLDYVIKQNYESIIQNRRSEATNQQIVQTNQQMLKRLAEMERRAHIATQYAEFAVNYNDATAYFSVADYLK